MWTLSMFFWEIRYLFSLSLLIYLWYGIGLFDLYLHYLVRKELRKVVKLPVEIDFVTCSLSGIALVKGIHVLAPPIEEDARWELSHIVTVEEVEVRFPFLIALFFFLLSYGELVVVDEVSVHGVRIYVEGFRAVVNTSSERTPSTSSLTASVDHNHAPNSAQVSTPPVAPPSIPSQEEVVYNVFLIGNNLHGKHNKHKKHHRRDSRSSQHTRRRRSLSENQSKDEDEGGEGYQSEKEIEGEEKKEECDGSSDQLVRDYGMRSFRLKDDYFPTILTNSPIQHNETKESHIHLINTLTRHASESREETRSSEDHHTNCVNAATTPSTSSSSSYSSSSSSFTNRLSFSSSGPPSVTPSQPQPRRHSLTNLLHETASNWKHKLHEKVTHIKNKAKELSEVVHESGGIYNATKQRLVHVYEKTKQSIDETIQEKITQLHIYLCGHEPLPAESMPRVICYHCSLQYIEIHLLRALPIQLRHLETKPLIVERLDFFDLGFDNLSFIPLPLASSPPLQTTRKAYPYPKNNLNSDPTTTAIEKKASKKDEIVDEAESECGQKEEINTIKSRKTPTRSISADSTLTSNITSMMSRGETLQQLLTRLQTASNQSSTIESARPTSLRSVSIRHAPQPSVTQTSTSPHHAEIEVVEEDPSEHLLDLFSIDVWQSGLDAMIFKYMFERKILLALFRSNAGRVINDFFTISNWLHKTHEGGGVDSNSDPLNHHNHHNHHNYNHPPLHRTSFSERYPSYHSQSQSQPQSRGIGISDFTHTSSSSSACPDLSSNRGIIVTHPIFFDT